jgi:hypothetical protein
MDRVTLFRGFSLRGGNQGLFRVLKFMLEPAFLVIGSLDGCGTPASVLLPTTDKSGRT